MSILCASERSNQSMKPTAPSRHHFSELATTPCRGLSLSRLGETGTVQRMTTQRIAGGTVHKLPADIRKAIESNAAAKSLWTDITPLARNEWICWVTSAKKEETRQRRIEVGIDKLRGGMRRPCCWPGCPHR